MKGFYLKKQDDTPEITLDPEKQVFSFIGKSMPENAAIFYKPIYDWFIDFFDKSPSTSIVLNVDLDYMNSSSIKLVFLIFSKINEHYNTLSDKSDIYINWRYNTNDDLTKQKGEEFKELFDIPIKVIVKN